MGAEAEDRGVHQVGVAESARGEREGKQEGGAGHIAEGIKMSGCRGGEGAECLGCGRRGWEVKERRNGKSGKCI